MEHRCLRIVTVLLVYASFSDAQLSPQEFCKTCSSEATCQFAGFVNGNSATFECKCKLGFTGNGTHCEDINECKEPRAVCNDDGHEACYNTNGGFVCTCQNGWKIKSNNPLVCEDVNECNDPSFCLNATKCENTKGAYKCICPAGYQYNNTAQRCEDIDECSATIDPCGVGGTCKNTDGSYECQCKSGFEPFGPQECGDVDECKIGSAVCHSDATCSNTIGSYTCNCNKGLAGDGLWVCRAGVQCGRGGNLYCDKNADCPVEFRPNFELVCKCKTGFTGSGQLCNDTNECETECKGEEFSGCLNTVGSYKCKCSEGYRLNEQSNACKDIDECLTDSLCVGRNSSCKNTRGSYVCNCPSGYKYTEEGCMDIDECAPPEVNPCGHDSTCANLEGSYRCECKEGYYISGDSCQDINECLNSPCYEADCKNSEGSFTCDCHDGFVHHNQTHCEIIPTNTAFMTTTDATQEATVKTNSPTANDSKTPTATIPTTTSTTILPTTIDTDGTTTAAEPLTATTAGEPTTAINIDKNECETECKGEEFSGCVNTVGSYRCNCSEGYRLNEQSNDCKDIDECLTDLPCVGRNSTCENTRGSYVCYCSFGYKYTEEGCTEITNQPMMSTTLSITAQPTFSTSLKLVSNRPLGLTSQTTLKKVSSTTAPMSTTTATIKSTNDMIKSATKITSTGSKTTTVSMDSTARSKNTETVTTSSSVNLTEEATYKTAKATSVTTEAASSTNGIMMRSTVLPNNSTTVSLGTTVVQNSTNHQIISCPADIFLTLPNKVTEMKLILPKVKVNSILQCISCPSTVTLNQGKHIIKFLYQDPSTGKNVGCSYYITVRRQQLQKCTNKTSIINLSEDQHSAEVTLEIHDHKGLTTLLPGQHNFKISNPQQEECYHTFIIRAWTGAIHRVILEAEYRVDCSSLHDNTFAIIDASTLQHTKNMRNLCPECQIANQSLPRITCLSNRLIITWNTDIIDKFKPIDRSRMDGLRDALQRFQKEFHQSAILQLTIITTVPRVIVPVKDKSGLYIRPIVDTTCVKNGYFYDSIKQICEKR